MPKTLLKLVNCSEELIFRLVLISYWKIKWGNKSSTCFGCWWFIWYCSATRPLLLYFYKILKNLWNKYQIITLKLNQKEKDSRWFFGAFESPSFERVHLWNIKRLCHFLFIWFKSFMTLKKQIGKNLRHP